MDNFSLLANYRDDADVMNTLKTHLWRQGLFGCFNNCSVCLITYLLPCVTFGVTAESRGKSCLLYGCMGAIPIAFHIAHHFQREDIRDIRGIPGSWIEDILLSLFCPWCVLCQERIEMESIQDDLLSALSTRNQGEATETQTQQQPPMDRI